MQKLIIILGLVLLSGTDALAANLKDVGETRHNNIETRGTSLSFTPTQVTSIKANRSQDTLTQEDRSNSIELRENPSLTVATVPPTPTPPPPAPDRGTPDNR